MKPFIKNIQDIQIEWAHDGSGSRQVLLNHEDSISSQLEAVTKWFLSPGFEFDWHKHAGVDEFWIVIQWSWVVEYKDGTKFEYKKDDIIYNPSDLGHRIIAQWKEESVYYFCRLNK